VLVAPFVAPSTDSSHKVFCALIFGPKVGNKFVYVSDRLDALCFRKSIQVWNVKANNRIIFRCNHIGPH